MRLSWGHTKPEREAFILALERIGARPKETILIDNSGANIQAAKEMGMLTVFIGNNNGSSNGCSHLHFENLKGFLRAHVGGI